VFQKNLTGSVENQLGSPSSSAGAQCSLPSKWSRNAGSSSSLLARCMLPVFRRRVRDTDTAPGADRVDTRWTGAQPAAPDGTAAIVESISADFTGDYCDRQTGSQHRRYARTMTTTSPAAVRKSHSLHNSSYLSSIACTGQHAHCQQQQQYAPTQPRHDDDDDDDKERVTATSPSVCPSDDHRHSVRPCPLLPAP